MLSLHYVDDPNELASKAILRQLNVIIESGLPSTTEGSSIPSNLQVEHKGNVLRKYNVTNGTVILEFRDSADCWIRAVVGSGSVITLPPNLYCRIPSSSNGKIIDSTVGAISLTKRFSDDMDGVLLSKYHNYRELVCELCRQFFVAGWVTGTGGSISIRHGNRIYMTPSGVQKERILPDELYVLDIDGEILSTPLQKPGCRAPKLSDCSPLFLHAFKQRNAGAVLHSHAFCCNLATSLFEGKSEFRISHQEMIKGITGYGYFDELTIPIIENTAWEHELADCLGETIAKYPKACAVLVRRHGMYVWGDSWEQAKRHGECLHYLFEVAINMRKLGMDFNTPPKPIDTKNDISHVIFDIEGTTTPITFVQDTLFPYASNNVKDYLTDSWSTSKTVEDVKQLISQAESDKSDNTLGAPVITNNSIEEISAYVQWCISKDRKIGSLKQLQGHIWEKGYESGKLSSVVYSDVPLYFQRLVSSGIKIGIYSSGSREAQKLLFKHSNFGDIRKYISCYFDTKIGNKRDCNSYKEILLSLGVDTPSKVVFITDIYEEAVAAEEAGLTSIISIRPGNLKIGQNHNFKTVQSFDEL